MASVWGTNPRPVTRGLKRSTSCMYSDKKSHIENIAPPTRSMETLAPMTACERNRRKGTSGARATRLSTTTNRARSTAASARGTIVESEDQAWVVVLATAQTNATSPPVTVRAPNTSSEGRSPSARVSARTTRAATRAAAATGRLM